MLRTSLSVAGNAINKLFGRIVSLPSLNCKNNSIFSLCSATPIHRPFFCLGNRESTASTDYKRLLLSPLVHQNESVRNLIKFSLRKGKRKSVHAVLKRFYRLDWGIWIRGKCGRNKKLYRKSANRKRRLRQHVFTNATQSWLLDKMVTRFWRKPRFYVDDPYEPYHKREEFPLTRKKPALPSS